MTAAVISHLHQDHIGGVAEIADADLLVSADEWRSLQPSAGRGTWPAPCHIDLPGLTWTPVDLDPLDRASLRPFTTGHDLFGDGSLVILPTPGHTAGSMSMLVRRPEVRRCCSSAISPTTFTPSSKGSHSGVGSRRQLRRTRDSVIALRSNNPGMRILAAHDPAAAGLLDAASGAFADTSS